MRKVILSLVFAMASAPAQTALPLSMKRAVDIAFSPDGNTRLQIAEELIQQSQERAHEARAALLPNFDGSISDSSNTRNLRAFGFQFPSIPGFTLPSLVGPFEVFDARVSGSQSVFDFGSIRRYQASKVAITATKAEAQGTRNQVADQVARAYLAALRATAALETAKANSELSDALVRLANSQKNAGTGIGIEVTRAQVQLANDKQRLTLAQNDRDRARLQLLRLLGLKLDGEVELTGALAYKAADEVAPAQALKTALEKRSELQAQEGRESGARLSYSGTKWERLPSVGVFGDYGTTGLGIDSSLPTRSVGISVKLPLFDGGRRDARRGEAASQLRTEELRTRDLKQQIELDVKLAIDSLHSAEAQVAAAEEGLSLSEHELEQARRRYEAGVATSIEVTDAQTRLQRARDNRISALFNHNLARIDLATATGTIQDLVSTF